MSGRGRGPIAAALLVALWILAIITSKARGRVPADLVDRETAASGRAALARTPALTHELPAAHDLGDPRLETYLDADGKPPELYLNGSGWDRTTGRVAPAVTFYARDPEFVEVEVQPADAQVQIAIGPRASDAGIIRAHTRWRSPPVRASEADARPSCRVRRLRARHGARPAADDERAAASPLALS